jgi:hypothetical protein
MAEVCILRRLHQCNTLMQFVSGDSEEEGPECIPRHLYGQV